MESFLRFPLVIEVAGRERPFAMVSCLLEIAGLVAGEREAAAGDACLNNPTRVLRFFQETQLERPRRLQFAP